MSAEFEVDFRNATNKHAHVAASVPRSAVYFFLSCLCM